MGVGNKSHLWVCEAKEPLDLKGVCRRSLSLSLFVSGCRDVEMQHGLFQVQRDGPAR